MVQYASFVPRIQSSQFCSCACSDNAIDDQVNAGCTTRSFAQTCWPLGDFSEQCQDIRLDEESSFFWSDTIFIKHFSIRRCPTRTQILRNSRTDCRWFYYVQHNRINRMKVSYVIQMEWRNRFHRKWAITVAHSPLIGIWYSSNTCTM